MTNPSRRIKTDPMHAVTAQNLLQQFRAGGVLAALECCEYWKEHGLDYRDMPTEFLAYLCDAGADFSAKLGPGSLGKLPSMNKIMNLSGVQKTPNAAKKRDQIKRTAHADEYIKSVVRKADASGENEYVSATGETAPIRNKRGDLTEAFRACVARDFKLGVGGTEKSRARTLNRHIDGHREK